VTSQLNRQPLQNRKKIVTSIDDLLNIQQIKELRIKYSTYFDQKELDNLMGLFTPDAVCEFGPEYGGNWEGSATIRNNFQPYLEDGEEPWKTMHVITNHLIEFTGPDTAKGRCYLLDLNIKQDNKEPLYLIGVYDDLYQKIDGQWLIHKTRIDFLWPQRMILPPR
jgi:ketosteroid isomerase-like protein